MRLSRLGLPFQLAGFVQFISVYMLCNNSLSRDHHANSLFESSRLLSPGTSNLISMTKRRTDRSKFAKDWLLSDQCQTLPDQSQNKMSSIPTKHYNQQHCVKAKMMKAFEHNFNCSILSMFGTGDLDTSTSICNRSTNQKMMNAMSLMDNITCPSACIEEWIELSSSFTLLSNEIFENACSEWKGCNGLTKEEAVWMDLYFSSLQTQVSGSGWKGWKLVTFQVTHIAPQQLIDCLSSIGGSLGLFLGGSIFSLIETFIIVTLFLTSIAKRFIKKKWTL